MSILTHIWTITAHILPFLFVLSLLVFFHELGHFFIGRWFGVKVDVFSLGFGPEIFGFDDRHGTHWRLAAMPLGGYVKFHGDVNCAMAGKSAVAAMSPQERAVSFCAQKVWKRAAIVAAGPIANFILAVVIFTGIFYVNGRAILLPIVDSVEVGSAAEAAGVQPDDLIVWIDGIKVDSVEEMQRIMQTASDTQLAITVNRGGQLMELVATPHRRDLVTAFGTTRVGVLGAVAKDKPENWNVRHFDFVDSLRLAGSETWYFIARSGGYLIDLVTGTEPADHLSGPIRMAEVSGAMAKLGLGALLNLAAILSISVGLLNFFPIPLLDGGHLLFYAAEAIRGKAMNEKAEQFSINIGFTLVTTLMFFVTYNDVVRLTRQWMR